MRSSITEANNATKSESDPWSWRALYTYTPTTLLRWDEASTMVLRNQKAPFAVGFNTLTLGVKMKHLRYRGEPLVVQQPPWKLTKLGCTQSQPESTHHPASQLNLITGFQTEIRSWGSWGASCLGQPVWLYSVPHVICVYKSLSIFITGLYNPLRARITSYSPLSSLLTATSTVLYIFYTRMRTKARGKGVLITKNPTLWMQPLVVLLTSWPVSVSTPTGTSRAGAGYWWPRSTLEGYRPLHCVWFLLSCDLSPWNLNKESKAQLYWVGDGDIIIKETNYVYKQVKPPGPGSGEVPAGDGPMFVWEAHWKTRELTNRRRKKRIGK